MAEPATPQPVPPTDAGDAEAQDRRNAAAWAARRAQVLAPFIAPGGVGAEIGVFKGAFARAILDTLAPQKLYLIDPWYLQGLVWRWASGNPSVIDALCGILHDLQTELASGKAVLWIENDLTALAKLPDGHLDWAYLDTTHQYQQTTQELKLLRTKVKPGGILAGDDWQADPAHRDHGVFQAVQEFVAREPCELVHVQLRQWVVRLA